MSASEQAQIEAAKKDPAHFAALYDAHFDRIYAFVASRVRNRAVAEDITSEVFVRALGAINSFEWRGVPFSAWLYRIASNRIASHASQVDRQGDASPSEEPAADEISVVERRATLFRLVDTLPGDQRRVIDMRFAEGRSIREIAELLGRSEGAVKQLQWRAIHNLRARMESS